MENVVVDILQCCIPYMHRDPEIGFQRTNPSSKERSSSGFTKLAEQFYKIGQLNKEKGSCTATDVPRSTLDFSIVPVKVKAARLGRSNNFILNYALLDGGSNTTFCTEALKDQLGLVGEVTKFSLTTIAKRNKETKSSVVSLELYDLEENTFIEMPTVFTMSSMLVSLADIFKQADVDRWPHLQEIKLNHVNTEVSLLVGNDNIKALKPEEIQKAKNGGPYAVKIQLG